MSLPLWPRVQNAEQQWKHLGSPLLWNLRGFIQRGRWWSQSFGIVKGWSWLIILGKGARQTVHIMQANWGGYAKIARKRQGKLTWGVLPLPDNAPAHMSQVAMTGATECVLKTFSHPPFSLDMANVVFYLFPKLKSQLRGTQYIVWKQWRHHWGSVLLFGGTRKNLLFWKDKKTRTEMG